MFSYWNNGIPIVQGLFPWAWPGPLLGMSWHLGATMTAQWFIQNSIGHDTFFFFAWKCHGKFCMSPQVLWMINSWVFGLDKELNQELIIFRSCIHSFSFFFLKVSKRHHIMLPKSFASWWCWLSTHLEKKDVQVKFGSFPKFHNFETFT